MGDDYIKWLSGLSKKDIPLAGGKGANLGEMYNNGFPVPSAFVVTTEAFFYFLKEAKLQDEIRRLLNEVDVDDSEKLEKKAKEIRELITNAKLPEALEKEILDSYDNFNVDLDGLKSSPGALSILKSSRESIFVSVRSSATAEDLEGASFAGQQDSFINVKGNKELIEKVKKVFASIFTARSIYYRKKKGFNDFVGIAAIVQKMINSEKSGVMFSHHPVKNSDNIFIEAVYGQGEGIVSGKIKPDHYIVNRKLDIIEEGVSDKKVEIIRTSSGQTVTKDLGPEKSKSRVLKTYEIKQLAEFGINLEKHYNSPQDVEFALANDEIFILQTRPMTALNKKLDEVKQELDGQILTQGLAASPGIASGIVKIVRSTEDLNKIRNGDVLVTTMTNPDMVVTMQKAAAIVTSEGGITAHASIVSREMGIPAVVGTENALDVLEDGQIVTVDGNSGKVFAGRAENKSVEINPIVKGTKTRIKVMVDLPAFAERAAKTEADGIGLVRLEGIIASSKKHPVQFEKEGKLDEYKDFLKKGLLKIAEAFIGKPIWVRTSDIRSDEYSNLEGAPKEIEKNPMLGDHGIRFSLKHPEILKAELRAIKELSEKGHKFGVMFPQIISLVEVKQAKAIFKELNMQKVAFGVMIETPAAAILIKDLCEEGLDFVSFGTNDLTQYTLAIDRGNENVQNIYDEMNWAVLKQISRVIRECKNYKVETSICGQAGSKPEMVEFLVKQGISSISVNADAAKKISELVLRLEGGNQSNNNSNNQQRSNSNQKGDVESPTVESIDDTNTIEVEIDEEVEEKLKQFTNHNQGEIEITDEMPQSNDKKKEDIFD